MNVSTGHFPPALPSQSTKSSRKVSPFFSIQLVPFVACTFRKEGELFIDAYDNGRHLSHEECLALLHVLYTPSPSDFDAAPPFRVRKWILSTKLLYLLFKFVNYYYYYRVI